MYSNLPLIPRRATCIFQGKKKALSYSMPDCSGSEMKQLFMFKKKKKKSGGDNGDEEIETDQHFLLDGIGRCGCSGQMLACSTPKR